VLKYAHSGEVSGDYDGVVGYLAAAFGRFDDAH
jgi:AmmeMemoRadiSam system protein B